MKENKLVDHYMNDPDCVQSDSTPNIYYIKTNITGGTTSGVLDIEPLLEQCKLGTIRTYSKLL